MSEKVKISIQHGGPKRLRVRCPEMPLDCYHVLEPGVAVEVTRVEADYFMERFDGRSRKWGNARVFEVCAPPPEEPKADPRDEAIEQLRAENAEIKAMLQRLLTQKTAPAEPAAPEEKPGKPAAKPKAKPKAKKAKGKAKKGGRATTSADIPKAKE